MQEIKKPLVLVVEDEETLCNLYTLKLTREGFDTEVAFNGVQGVTKAKLTKPDIILLDIMMPIKNGISALEELKADELTKNIPVIMLTNLSEPDYVNKAIALGARGYIVKSASDPSLVVEKVREVLGIAKPAVVRQEVQSSENLIK
jgi:two-component system alkaline phosphatase synthesis response regulator PhoP